MRRDEERKKVYSLTLVRSEATRISAFIPSLNSLSVEEVNNG
jgi:hypothetical protein